MPITAGSCENNERMSRGKIREISVTAPAPPAAVRRQRPRDWRIPRMSLLPQNWAVNTAVPVVIPYKYSISRKNTWFAKPTEAISTSPNWPIIRVSTMASENTRKFCRAMGTARRRRVWKKRESRKGFLQCARFITDSLLLHRN